MSKSFINCKCCVARHSKEDKRPQTRMQGALGAWPGGRSKIIFGERKNEDGILQVCPVTGCRKGKSMWSTRGGLTKCHRISPSENISWKATASSQSQAVDLLFHIAERKKNLPTQLSRWVSQVGTKQIKTFLLMRKTLGPAEIGNAES